MRILYIECKMGVAGDMLNSALYEIAPKKQEFLEQIISIFGDKVKISLLDETKCGIHGTRFSVEINGVEEDENTLQKKKCCINDEHHCHNHDEDDSNKARHSHNDLSSIKAIISHLNVSEKVKKNAEKVYNLIASAESKAHNVEISKIHFHEVGEIDAIVDIVGACILIEQLNVDKIICSPINLGGGFVKCAHGVLPVPAPATAELIKGMQAYSTDITSELATPTGVAILKNFANEFSNMPNLTIENIGYGMGKKNFDKANCVRVFVGNINQAKTMDEIVEISCNLDDMTSEEIGFATDTLLSLGAKDVFTTPIYMKKNRPSYMLTCLCSVDEKDTFAKAILTHTSTIGVRIAQKERVILDRKFEQMDTSLGKVTIKTSKGEGVVRSKVEFDDIAKIAKACGKSFSEVKKFIDNEISNKKQ